MGNEMGNTNVSGMQVSEVEEEKAEAHSQDQFLDISLIDPVKRQPIVEEPVLPSEEEEIEEKRVISASEDQPNSGDRIENQLSDEKEEKKAREAAGSVSTELESPKSEQKTNTLSSEENINETSNEIEEINGTEKILHSSMVLEDKVIIYSNLDEANCETEKLGENAGQEKETIGTNDDHERETRSGPYGDFEAKDVMCSNQIQAKTSMNIDQVDENADQEEQEVDKSGKHEENIRSHAAMSESAEAEIVACDALVQLKDDGTKIRSYFVESPESSNRQDDDIQIKKHIQNIVLKLMEDRHEAELGEYEDHSSLAHESHIEETDEKTVVNEDDLLRAEVPIIITAACKDKKETTEPMIASVTINEIDESKDRCETHEEANPTQFTPRRRSLPLEILSETEVHKSKMEFGEVSSPALYIVPPYAIICDLKKEYEPTDALEENISNTDSFSEKQTDQSESMPHMKDDKTETFSRNQDDKPDQVHKAVVPPMHTVFQKKIENGVLEENKEDTDSSTEKQSDHSEKVPQMNVGDTEVYYEKEDDQPTNDSKTKHDKDKFLKREDYERERKDPEMVEVGTPIDGKTDSVNHCCETVKDAAPAKQAETTEAIELKEVAGSTEPIITLDQKMLAQGDAIMLSHCKASEAQNSFHILKITLEQESFAEHIGDIISEAANRKANLEKKGSEPTEDDDLVLQQIAESPNQKTLLQSSTQYCTNVVIVDAFTNSRLQNSILEMKISGEHEQDQVKSESDAGGQSDNSKSEKMHSDFVVHDLCKESPTQKSCSASNIPLEQESLTKDISAITTDGTLRKAILENKTSELIIEDVKFQQITYSRCQKMLLQSTAQIGDFTDILVSGLQSSAMEMENPGEEQEDSDSLDQSKVSQAEKCCFESGSVTEQRNCTKNSESTDFRLDKGLIAPTALIGIDDSDDESAKVSASKGSESGKLRTPLKILFKTNILSHSVKEENHEASKTGEPLNSQSKKISLPSSRGREKQKTRSIFSSCMCCTAVIR